MLFNSICQKLNKFCVRFHWQPAPNIALHYLMTGFWKVAGFNSTYPPLNHGYLNRSRNLSDENWLCTKDCSSVNHGLDEGLFTP